MTLRLTLLLNPHAGAAQRIGAGALRESLLAAAGDADVRVREIDGDPEAAAMAACEDEAGVIAVAGGDGTARAAAQAVARTGCDVSVVPLPLGTANLLPHRLYAQRSAQEVLSGLEDYRPIRLHAGVVGDSYFFVAAAAGFPAQLAEAREDMREGGRGRKLMGALGRAKTALGAAFKPSLKLYGDDAEVYYQRASAVLLAPGGLDRVFSTGPLEAGPPDFECIAAHPQHVFDAASMTLSALMRTWRDHPRVRERWAKTLTVRGRDPLPVMLDGEPREIPAPARFDIIPEAVSFLAPPK